MGAANADADFKFGVVPLPLGESGRVYLGGEGIAIGAHSANPDLAWAYLQSSYLSVEGQLLAAEMVGSLPSRADAGQADQVSGNELLAPFAQTIATMGTKYPAEVIPPASVADVQLRVGQAWSSVIGRQHTPEVAASTLMNALAGLLG